MIDLMFRATDKASWDAFAEASGLTDEGNPIGCYIDEIGPVVITPAVVGPDRTILTPAVMDDRHHVNLRLSQPFSTYEDADGDIVEVGHNPAILAEGGDGVDWVDPATVNNPRRIWAGGMSYWIPEE